MLWALAELHGEPSAALVHALLAACLPEVPQLPGPRLALLLSAVARLQVPPEPAWQEAALQRLLVELPGAGAGRLEYLRVPGFLQGHGCCVRTPRATY